MYDVIIVGGGPAGLTAAIYARRGGLKTLLFEMISFGGQMNLTGDIENYPGYSSIKGYELGENMKKTAEELGVEFVSEEIVSVDFSAEVKKVSTENKSFDGKTVILAMGARARNLGIPDEEKFIGAGLSYCAHCDGNFFKKKDVVVVGGGNTALTDALYLSNISNKVFLVHRRDEFRGGKVLVDRLRKKENVSFLLSKNVTAILGENKISELEITDKTSGDKERVKAEGLFIAVGTTPNSELIINDIILDENGFVVADENMQTSVLGVYAVGDLRKKPLRQVVTAAADGAVAANHILSLLA